MPNITHHRFFLLSSMSILFLILIINYLDRTVIAFAITPIQQTFHLNNAQFGAIAGAFGIGYTLLMLISGILVDHIKARKVLTFSLLLWSVASICTGFANGFWMLFIFRILLGVFEAPAFPSNIQIVSHWLPMTSRVKALSIGNAAIPLACAIGAPLISNLITRFDWRITYFILGGAGIILSLLWLMIYRDNPKGHDNLEFSNTKHSSTVTWKFMLFNPTILTNNLSYFALGYLLFFSQTWLPGYLEQIYHLKLKSVGLFLIAPWLLAAITVVLCAILSDKLYTKTNSLRIARSHIIWICQLLSAICLIPVITYHNLTVALIFITLSVGFGLAPNALFDSTNIDLAKHRAGTNFGIMNTFCSAGAIIAPWITGWLTHITGDFKAAILLMVILTFSSVLAVIFFHHPDKYR